jgi:hypothetical protein
VLYVKTDWPTKPSVLTLKKKRLIIQFCTGGCEERTSEREAEEFPILDAVARERLVKAQQAGKGLVAAVVIC